MAGLDFSPVAGGRGSRPELDDISDVVRDSVEEIFTWGKDNPTARLQSPEFDSKEEAETFLSEMRAYAYHRKDSKGRLVVSGNTAKGATKGKYVFRARVDVFVGAPETATDAE